MASTCIVDFNGYTSPGSFLVAFWADWHPNTGYVEFGGDWEWVPAMPTKTEPTQEQVYGWVETNKEEE